MIQFLSADLMGITIYDIIIKITLGYLVIHSSFMFSKEITHPQVSPIITNVINRYDRVIFFACSCCVIHFSHWKTRLISLLSCLPIFHCCDRCSFRCVAFHDYFGAILLYFIENFTGQPSVKLGNGYDIFDNTSDRTHKIYLFQY